MSLGYSRDFRLPLYVTALELTADYLYSFGQQHRRLARRTSLKVN